MEPNPETGFPPSFPWPLLPQIPAIRKQFSNLQSLFKTGDVSSSPCAVVNLQLINIADAESGKGEGRDAGAVPSL